MPRSFQPILMVAAAIAVFATTLPAAAQFRKPEDGATDKARKACHESYRKE